MTDWHVFMWQSLEILNIFNTLTLKQIFWKTQIPFTKPEEHFLVESTEIDNATIPYKTALSEANVKTNRMGSRKWNITKNRVVLPVIFFSEDFSTSFFFSTSNFKILFKFRTLYKKLFLVYQLPKCSCSYFSKTFRFYLRVLFPCESLRKKVFVFGVFWFVFSRIRTKNGEIQCISLYSVRMRENMDQNNSEYGHFLRSEYP